MDNEVKDIMVCEYEEYIENVLNISRLTTEKNSIFFQFDIEEGLCKCNISMLEQQHGDKNEFGVKNYNFDELLFESFLKKLVGDFYENSDIVINDIVNLDGDEFVAFRMITKFNDLFTINGLTKEQAKELKQVISAKKAVNDKSKKKIKVTSESGNASIYVFLGIIVLAIIILILYFVFK